MIQKSVSILKNNATKKSIGLDVVIDDNLPQWICGDPVKLSQIMTNLISNGIKFTEKGSILVTAKAEASETNLQNIVISVKDSGVGIPEKAKSKLFKSFSQEDASTTRKFGGTGLGLSICKGLIELMGGKIWIEGGSEEGATFSISFPAQEAQTITAKVESKKASRHLLNNLEMLYILLSIEM